MGSFDEGYAECCLNISGSWTQELAEEWNAARSSPPGRRSGQPANDVQSSKTQQAVYSSSIVAGTLITFSLLVVVTRLRRGNVADHDGQEAEKRSFLPAP